MSGRGLLLKIVLLTLVNNTLLLYSHFSLNTSLIFYSILNILLIFHSSTWSAEPLGLGLRACRCGCAWPVFSWEQIGFSGMFLVDIVDGLQYFGA